MIVYPKDWMQVGQSIKLKDIEDTILKILKEIDCCSISFSGGLDSSLMLYYMSKVYDRVYAFTMGSSESHPDIEYSRLVVDGFTNVIHRIYIPSGKEIENAKRYPEDLEGDLAVRLFYDFVGKHTDRIIACDGIDEFMCGYYGHQNQGSYREDTYYDYLSQLRAEHLITLDWSSKQILVYLLYLDSRLLLLFAQIPISEKVDGDFRKKIMLKLAKGKIPDEVINRRKYGFCDVLKIKV